MVIWSVDPINKAGIATFKPFLDMLHIFYLKD
jgi:hypothetical protein